MLSEQWKPVRGIEDRYEVSDLGRVRSISRVNSYGRKVVQRILKPTLNCQSGRPTVYLYFSDGRRRRVFVHTLVLEAFVGPRPVGMEACHDPDPSVTNCRLNNLRWGSKVENRADQRKHGTELAGEKHPNSKVTEAIVLKIRSRVASGELQSTVAADTGLSFQQVSRIVRRERWKHV